jgi:hypothetical protein
MKRALVVVAAIGCFVASPARAQPPAAPQAAIVDATAVRFYAPETGDADHPRFITERTLAFEARIEAMNDRYEGATPYLERHVRSALERHIAEEMLSRLPLDGGPAPDARARIVRQFVDIATARAGGRAAVLGAAAAEGLTAQEIDLLFARQAAAAIYVDTALTPVLHATDDQLRQVFRTAAHPYRGTTFDDARERLEKWFVMERLRSAEGSYFQTARARVKIVLVPR